MHRNFVPALLAAALLSSVAIAADENPALVTSNTAPVQASESEAVPQPDENGFYPGAEIYVSDNVNALLRSGPNPNNRSVGVLHPGDQVTFVEYSKDKRYVLIRSVDKTFWMRKGDLQSAPAAVNRLAGAQHENERLQNEIERLQSEIERLQSSDSGKELTEAQERVSALEEENASLKDAVSEKDASIEKLTQELKAADSEPENRELNMQMRWWLQGALIALGGAVAGIIFVMLPKPRRRKRERF